jgi:hypothetical protein
MQVLNSGSPSRIQPSPLCAELVGDDTIIAGDLSIVAYTPVLELCRELVAAGRDPKTPLEVYRGNTVCLSIRSIGEAATLEINNAGDGFRRRREPDAAAPVANGSAARPMKSTRQASQCAPVLAAE